jgi:hypothetical protein
MNEDFVVVPIVFGTICWIAWLIFSTIRHYRTAKVQGEIQSRLLERFSSSQDLLAYVESDGGRQFVRALTTEQTTPYGRILSAAQAGIIMVFFGVALLILRGRVGDAEPGFVVFGTLILTLGVGFGVSAAVSYFLSKSFGLLDGPLATRH